MGSTFWICPFLFNFKSNPTGSSMSSLESAIHQFPVQSVGPVPVAVPAASSTSAPVLPAATPSCPRCNEVSNLRMPCFCALEMCVGWYPCGLKYCKGDRTDQSANGQNSQNYKCGIKTCRKCSQFIYYVRQKQHCLWDEWRVWSEWGAIRDGGMQALCIELGQKGLVGVVIQLCGLAVILSIDSMHHYRRHHHRRRYHKAMSSNFVYMYL